MCYVCFINSDVGKGNKYRSVESSELFNAVILPGRGFCHTCICRVYLYFLCTDCP